MVLVSVPVPAYKFYAGVGASELNRVPVRHRRRHRHPNITFNEYLVPVLVSVAVAVPVTCI